MKIIKGEKTDLVGKDWAGPFFPRGKKTDLGEFRPVTPGYTHTPITTFVVFHLICLCS